MASGRKEGLTIACALVLGAVLSTGAWAAGGSSKLSQKPIPLQTEAHSIFAVEDISDYEGLVAAIRADSEDAGSPGGRIWEVLPPVLRAELDGLGDTDHYEDNVKYRIINGLNGVIRRRDLYTSEAFGDVGIGQELMSTLDGGLEMLSAIDATKSNRDLLQASFPDYILDSQVRPFPKRPLTLRIFGDDFLNSGNLQKGFTIPTGAVWQPSLLAFGTFRSAWQYQDTGDRDPDIPVRIGDPAPSGVFPGMPMIPQGPDIRGQEIESEEWVNRLDLFFNLYFTQTERIVLGLRPIDEDGIFSGYVWQPNRQTELDEWEGSFDTDIEQLFFEGDFGEIFPNLDILDERDLDFGFAIGRQPLFLQEGILINDIVDGIGITRNNIIVRGTSNLRITGFWGWQGLHRGVGGSGPGRGLREDSADLYGLFTSIDFPWSTVDFDVAYVDDDERFIFQRDGSIVRRGGDQLNIGLSFVQRFGQVNTAFRFNTSAVMGGDDTADASDGQVIFAEISWTPPRAHNLLYGTFFWANDDYRSIARDPATGGPLGRTGILFEAFGIGRQGAPLSNEAFEAVGGAIGYQWFPGTIRKQFIFEVGGRTDTNGRDDTAYGGAIRYQQALKNRFVWRSDVYYVERNGRDDRKGVRTEFVVQF